MPAINPTDLDNAKRDVDTIAGIANSQADTIRDRFGRVRRTMQGVENAFDSAVDYANSLRPAAAQAVAEAVGNLTTEELDGLAGSTGASMIGSGARSVQNRLDEQVSLRQEGGVLDGATDDAAALLAANAIAQGRPILIDGVAHINSPVTITSPLVDVRRQIFTAISQVTIANGQAIRPEWFGGGAAGTVLRAHEAGPATGGFDIAIPRGRTRAGGFVYGAGSTTPVYLSKPAVRVLGTGMPGWSDNMDRLQNGSIIEGNVIGYANDIELRDLGVDSGKFTCDSYYGSVPQEALTITYPGDTFKAANTLRRGLKLNNIRTLCYAPLSPVHCLIAGEGMTDITLGGAVEAAYGVHGIVFKGSQVSAGALRAYMNGSEGVIVKSDTQGTSTSKHIDIASTFTTSAGPEGTTPHTASTGVNVIGLMINPQNGPVSFVQVGSVRDVGNAAAIGLQYGDNGVVDNVQIGSLTGESNTYATANLAVPAGAQLQRFQIGQLIARNSPIGVLSNTGNPRIGQLHAVACGVAADISGNSGISIGETSADAPTDGVFRISQNARPSLGPVTRSSLDIPIYTTTAGLFAAGTDAALVNDWEQFPGNDKFGVIIEGGRAYLSGLIRPGLSTSNIFATVPFFAQPARAQRLQASGRNSAGQNTVPVTVGTDGNLLINEIAGGIANVTTWLSLAGLFYDLTD